uniref:Uncharacterized protein n=1 Tax=Strongyloides stercoralis TaxID=6248 RepID=A0A0K0EAA3_STRER
MGSSSSQPKNEEITIINENNQGTNNESNKKFYTDMKNYLVDEMSTILNNLFKILEAVVLIYFIWFLYSKYEINRKKQKNINIENTNQANNQIPLLPLTNNGESMQTNSPNSSTREILNSIKNFKKDFFRTLDSYNRN